MTPCVHWLSRICNYPISAIISHLQLSRTCNCPARTSFSSSTSSTLPSKITRGSRENRWATCLDSAWSTDRKRRRQRTARGKRKRKRKKKKKLNWMMINKYNTDAKTKQYLVVAFDQKHHQYQVDFTLLFDFLQPTARRIAEAWPNVHLKKSLQHRREDGRRSSSTCSLQAKNHQQQLDFQHFFPLVLPTAVIIRFQRMRYCYTDHTGHRWSMTKR